MTNGLSGWHLPRTGELPGVTVVLTHGAALGDLPPLSEQLAALTEEELDFPDFRGIKHAHRVPQQQYCRCPLSKKEKKKRVDSEREHPG